MRVLLLTKHLNIGGIARYTTNLAKELKKNNITVFVASSGGRLVSELEKLGIKHIFLDLNYKNEFSLRVFSLKNKLINIIRENKIDLIHAQRRTAAVLSYLASRSTKVPYITTCHGFYNIRFLRKIFPFWGKRVIAVSEYVYDQIKDILKVDKAKIKLIPNAIDVESFAINISEKEKTEIKKRYSISNGPVIGNISRFSLPKGHDILCKAFKTIQEVYQDANLVMVGGGKDKSHILELVSKLNLEKSIKLIEELKDTKEALAIMDVFCFPSQSEAFGLAILEAMSSGVCVVASDIDGIKTIITDNHDGFLVSPKDYEGFAGKVLALLKDRALYDRIKIQAIKTARERFNIEDMVDKVIEVYKEALE